MTRRSPLPQTPHHVSIYDEDWEFIQTWYGSGAPAGRRLGASAAIREIVNTKVRQLRQLQIAGMDEEKNSPTLQ